VLWLVRSWFLANSDSSSWLRKNEPFIFRPQDSICQPFRNRLREPCEGHYAGFSKVLGASRLAVNRGICLGPTKPLSIHSGPLGEESALPHLMYTRASSRNSNLRRTDGLDDARARWPCKVVSSTPLTTHHAKVAHEEAHCINSQWCAKRRRQLGAELAGGHLFFARLASQECLYWKNKCRAHSMKLKGLCSSVKQLIGRP
jgi:hypothetical protein